MSLKLKALVHFCAGKFVEIFRKVSTEKVPQTDSLFSFLMKSCHVDLKFKARGFDFDAKGRLAIGAAIVIVLLVLLIPRLFY
jgi:hypothetical protein